MEIDREKLKVLVIGIAGIYTLYFIGSLIQERMYSYIYVE